MSNANMLAVKVPVDGRVYAEVKLSSYNDIARVFALSREAQRSWRQTTLAERARICSAAVDAFEAKGKKIAEELSWQMGRPAPLMASLETGMLRVGNLNLFLRLHVLIGPEDVLEGLAEQGRVDDHQPFAPSQGCVLLIRKGNPASVRAIEGLFRDEVRIACSNPETEKASFQVSVNTLAARTGTGDDVRPPSKP